MHCCFDLEVDNLEKEMSKSSVIIGRLCDMTINPNVYICKGNESIWSSSHCETTLHRGQGLLTNNFIHLSHIVCPQSNNKGITPRKGTNSETNKINKRFQYFFLIIFCK